MGRRKMNLKKKMKTHKPGSLWHYKHFTDKDYVSLIFDFLVPSTFNMEWPADAYRKHNY